MTDKSQLLLFAFVLLGIRFIKYLFDSQREKKARKEFADSIKPYTPKIGVPKDIQVNPPQLSFDDDSDISEDEETMRETQTADFPAGNYGIPSADASTAARPLLTRSPYAERSDYGHSPLDTTTPPPRHPTELLLDKVLLTAEDLDVDRQDNRELPLESPAQNANDAEENTQRVVAQSLASAFPKAVAMAKATRPGVHRPIVLHANGKNVVRHAVLMSEVLGRPRSFDL